MITITSAQWQQVGDILSQTPTDVFLSWSVRQHIAKTRWEASAKILDIHAVTTAGVMPGTIRHNSTETQNSVFGSARRSQRLLGPLSGLDPVYSGAAGLKVLSIGPRTEMEIFHLIGLGFKPENIKALDLISSSPMIEKGDMHAMPYDADSFDVVISSWVLNYSSEPQIAVNEMLRVVKPGGLIAIGVTYAPPDERPDPTIIGSMQRNCADIRRYFHGTYFESLLMVDPPSDNHRGPVMLIARVK